MNKYTLAPYVQVGFLENTLHFGFGSLRRLIKAKDLQDCLLEAALFFKQSHSMDEAVIFLNAAGHNERIIQEVLQILSSKFLILDGLYEHQDRYSRSLLFYSLSGAELQKIQSAISKKSVAIVGCGGIGNVIGALLATAGVGELILIDEDTIELSNLSRQVMFKEGDCGKYKTEVLKKAFSERSSQIKIVEIREFVNESNIHCLKNVDFILLSGDEGNVVDFINTFAVENRIPFINVGYIEDIAVWGPLVIPGKSGCHQCQQHLVNFNNLTQDQINKCNQINKGYQAPSIGPINMMASSFAALDILKYLGNFGQIHSLNTRIGIWTHDLHIEKQDYSLNPACKLCGSLQAIN